MCCCAEHSEHHDMKTSICACRSVLRRGIPRPFLTGEGTRVRAKKFVFTTKITKKHERNRAYFCVYSRTFAVSNAFCLNRDLWDEGIDGIDIGRGRTCVFAIIIYIQRIGQARDLPLQNTNRTGNSPPAYGNRIGTFSLLCCYACLLSGAQVSSHL